MGGVWRARLETRCEIRYATRRSRNVQRETEGGREEVPSGSLRVAAAAAAGAEAAEWMDGLWDGRQSSGAPHGYLRSRARTRTSRGEEGGSIEREGLHFLRGCV